MPDFGCYKLNVDDYALENPGVSGSGIVLRDWQGSVIFAESLYYESGSTRAEIKVLFHGLQLCSERDFCQCLC